MKKLVLLRHGESQWNLENRFTGWTNVDLTQKGEEEAKKAGELLNQKAIEFDVQIGQWKFVLMKWVSAKYLKSLIGD